MDVETPVEQEVAISDTTLEQLPGSQVKVSVHVDAHDVNHAFDAALGALGKRVKIPGFRPGKAPTAFVEKTVGSQMILQEATDHLLTDVYRKVVLAEKLDPVGDPDVESVGVLERDQPVDVVFTVPVRPQVVLGDYKTIRVEEIDTAVTDEEVDSMIEEIRNRLATSAPVERPAAASDIVKAFIAMRKDGEIVGGSEDQEQEIILDRARLIDGMVDGIVGMKIGEERSFPITLPEDYPTESLRNVGVETHVTVNGVLERELPPIDDALAEQDGHGTTLEELRSYYAELLTNQKLESAKEQFESKVLDTLDSGLTVELPEVMITLELDQWWMDTAARFDQMGIPFEKYLEYTNGTPEKWRAERKDEAVKRIRLRLALDAIADAEGVEVDEAQVTTEVEHWIDGRKVKQDELLRTIISVRRQLVRQGALTRMIEIARGEE